MKHKILISLSLLGFFLLIITTGLVAKKVEQPKESAATKHPIIDTVKIDYSQRKAPVAPFLDTLFYVYGSFGASSPQQRADIIDQNIRTLSKDPFFDKDSLKVEIEGGVYNIIYFDKVVMGINDIQAEVLEKSKSELTEEYLNLILQSIEQEKSITGWKIILKQALLAILILGLTFLILKYLNIGYRILKFHLTKEKNWTIEKIKFILDVNKQVGIVLFLLKLLRLLCIAVVIYFCLYAFLSLFPETKWIAETLINYVLSPLKMAYRSVVNFIPNLFTIIIICLLFRFVISAIKALSDRVSDGSITINGFYPDWAAPTFSIVKVVLYIFMSILIFHNLPIADSKAFQGVSVFLGILFSLGSTSVIANVVSGIVITYMRPFKLGDRIRMGEFAGNVIEKTPLVTRLKTPKNEIITIPNGTIMSAQTINYTHSAEEYGLILYTSVTMGYDTPWRKVHELLIEAGLKTPRVQNEPKPFVLQLALNDFYVEYQINVYTKDANYMPAIYSDLNKNIQDIFNREGIELLSPQFVAQRDGSTVNIPKEYVKTGFERVSPFNMKVQITKEE